MKFLMMKKLRMIHGGINKVKKLLAVILKVVLFFIGWAVCTGLGTIPSDHPALWRLGAEALPLAYIIIFSMAFWLLEKRRIEIISLQRPVFNIVIGTGTGILWLGMTVAVMALLGVLKLNGRNEIPYLGIWLLACLLNVMMQELLVRGYIYQLIKSKYNTATAIIVSTTLFTLMHGGAFEAGIIPVLNVVTMSVFVTLVMEYTGSILAPTIIHAIWNGVGAIILGGVSLADDYPHLYNLLISGNDLLSGGICKIEGSIVVLAVNVILSIIFFYSIRQTKKLTISQKN